MPYMQLTTIKLKSHLLHVCKVLRPDAHCSSHGYWRMQILDDLLFLAEFPPKSPRRKRVVPGSRIAAKQKPDV